MGFLLASASATGTPAIAQAPGIGAGQDYLTPPRSEAAQSYERAAARLSVRSDASYSTSDDPGPRPRAEREAIPDPFRPAMIPRDVGLILVFAGIALALFFWFRYGSGGLLAGGPRELKVAPTVPDGWHGEASDGFAVGQDPIAVIAALSDRREAMVRLLRLCLLHGATITQTRLARSDTERLVLGRLPPEWVVGTPLPELLKRTELVHYGGRTLSDAEFATSLEAARRVLARGADGVRTSQDFGEVAHV